MLLERLRRYVSEPLYHNLSYTGDEFLVLRYSLNLLERRITEVLSVGMLRDLQPYMECFPWQELEELLGEHLERALRASQRLFELAAARGETPPQGVLGRYLGYRSSYGRMR